MKNFLYIAEFVDEQGVEITEKFSVEAESKNKAYDLVLSKIRDYAVDNGLGNMDWYCYDITNLEGK